MRLASMRGTLKAALLLPLLALLVGLVLPVDSFSQARPSKTAKAQAKPAESRPPVQRRDPFVSLVPRPGATGPQGPRPPGKAGLAVSELVIQGVVMMAGDPIAVVTAPGRNRAYFLRERDELFDGYVSRITPDNVVFREKSKDAYGRPYEKEVVKQLTAGSGAKR